MKTIKLNNNSEIPILGFGTYQLPKSLTEETVSEALRQGYRLIDTAQCYGNEKEVGLACKKSGIPRNELFITTKLWGVRGFNDTLNSIEASLKELDLEYIDLLLLHEPMGNVSEIYKAMEKAYNEGKVKAIGVSNFIGKDFETLIKDVKVLPAINQLETHVYRQQNKMRDREKELGIVHQSWSPLACGRNNIFNDPILLKIAQNYNVTPAQVALRFLTQQNIIAIPKSTHKERMIENINSLNFNLSENEINEIKKLDQNKSLFNWW